ncbi:hypothetical protein KJ554_00340 [bacterium]|nr:hypothetical protein [bacterium]
MVMLAAAFVAGSGVGAIARDPADEFTDRFVEGEENVYADGPEIRDPFFEFVTRIVENDSLGVWSRDDLSAYVAASGRPTKLPIDRVVAFSRLGDGKTSRRVVRLELDGDLELPLPYSILGYHPGTLFVSHVVVATEIDLHDAMLRVPDDQGRTVRFWASGMKALVLGEGYVVLDVDGLVDRLLGGKLDDTWMEGFLLARVRDAPVPGDDGLNGLALGRSREGRPLSGSFDFRRDKVLPNNRPVARALALYARRLVTLHEKRAWSRQP